MATEIAVLTSNGEMSRFMPIMDIAQAIQRYNALLEFTKQIMKEGKDYGAVPGTDKPTLLKPGAEKLCSFFGLTPKFEIIEKLEMWTGEEPFFYYFYRCRLYRGDHLIAEADGSCNTRESKYRYRWVQDNQLPPGMDKALCVSRGGRISEPDFAITKAETAGKYGKSAAYWQAFRDAINNGQALQIEKPKRGGGAMAAWEIDSTAYRVPNPDICDQVNTCQKMAQKRALIAVTLIGCNASEYFTQDLEDMESINVAFAEVKPESKREPTPAQLPEELEALFGPDAPKRGTTTAFEICRRELMEADPEIGETEYHRLLEHNGIKREGGNPVAKVRQCVTQMWVYAQSLKALKAKATEPPLLDQQKESL